MKRATILAALSAMTLAIGSAPAFACSCIDSGPACQAYWKSGPVFDATVDSIDVPRADAARPPREALETVHATVHQSCSMASALARRWRREARSNSTT